MTTLESVLQIRDTFQKRYSEAVRLNDDYVKHLASGALLALDEVIKTMERASK